MKALSVCRIVWGVGEALKMRDPSIKIVAVEPSDSPVLSGGKPYETAGSKSDARWQS